MKHIRKFESNKSNDIFKTIRDILVEFEDDKIIIYSCSWESFGAFNFNPERETDERFVNNLKIISNRRDNLHIKIICNIKLPKDLNKKGIEVLEDVIVATKRLEIEGIESRLDLGGNHHLYKPCSIELKIPINLFG